MQTNKSRSKHNAYLHFGFVSAGKCNHFYFPVELRDILGTVGHFLNKTYKGNTEGRR